MKTSTTSVLGFENVPVSGVPETLAECVSAAGGEQNLVDQWVGFVNAHRTNTEARGIITDTFEEVFSIARSTKQKATPSKSDPNKTTEVYDESEQQFSDRVRAETKQTTEQIWEAITASDAWKNNTTDGAIPFKAIGAPRGSGMGRLAKQDTTNAETLIKAGKSAAAVDMLQSKNPGLTIELDDAGVAKVESLAAALRTNRQRLQKEEDAALGLAA
jgi:hypothetical protein